MTDDSIIDIENGVFELRGLSKSPCSDLVSKVDTVTQTAAFATIDTAKTDTLEATGPVEFPDEWEHHSRVLKESRNPTVHPISESRLRSIKVANVMVSRFDEAKHARRASGAAVAEDKGPQL